MQSLRFQLRQLDLASIGIITSDVRVNTVVAPKCDSECISDCGTDCVDDCGGPDSDCVVCAG